MSQEDNSLPVSTESEPEDANKDQLQERVTSILYVKLEEFKKEMFKHIKTAVSDEIGKPETTDDSSKTDDICANEDWVNWKKKAKEELGNARQTAIKSLKGVHTVLCLDTSDSMNKNNAWCQAKQFLGDYFAGLRDEFNHNRKYYNTAIVTFGNETKMVHRLTKDIGTLEEEIGDIKCSGSSPLAAGLIFSKVAIESTHFRWADLSGGQEIPSRIIVITDGQTCTQEDRNNAKDEIIEIRSKSIEIHFVYVGEPDIVYLYKLRQFSNGEMLPYTSGRRLAKDTVVKRILDNEKDFKKFQKETHCGKGEESKHAENTGEESDKEENPIENLWITMNQYLKEAFYCLQKITIIAENGDCEAGQEKPRPILLTIIEEFLRCQDTLFTKQASTDDQVKAIADQFENMEKVYTVLKSVFKPTYYEEDHDMQAYAPIGARVRRGEHWRWGNQDNGGPGTIIGHSSDELNNNWCFVEWDMNGDKNAYRYEMHGKRDLIIIEEERVSNEGHTIFVGSKVKPGTDYTRPSTHELGIAIKLLDGNKVHVRWADDGSREELTNGKDETPHQLEPIAVKGTTRSDDEISDVELDKNAESSDASSLRDTRKPAPPEHLEVCDVYERTAYLRWEKSIDHKDGRETKYTVIYGETDNPKKKIVVDIVNEVCLYYKLDDLKPGSEYAVDVRFVNDEGESLPSKSVTFTTMKSDTDDSHYAGWKLFEKDAARLSSAIGENWEILGPALGLRKIPFHRIKADNQTTDLRIFSMLVYWLNNDQNPTFGKFLKILRNNSTVDIDYAVINSIKEEFQLKEKSKTLKAE